MGAPDRVSLTAVHIQSHPSMQTITYPSAPSITLEGHEAPHGALLNSPLVLLDVDSLPESFRLAPAAPMFADVNWTAKPGAPFTGAWRACTPGGAIVVKTTISCTSATVYVETSADGVTKVDGCSAGNAWGYAEVGFRFRSSLPFYRLVVAVGDLCRGSAWTQQR